MSVGKIYEYLELWDEPHWPNPMITFRFRRKNSEAFTTWPFFRISDFAEDGKVTQKDMLEMLYPGYPWDYIIKLYNEAPRSQK